MLYNQGTIAKRVSVEAISLNNQALLHEFDVDLSAVNVEVVHASANAGGSTAVHAGGYFGISGGDLSLSARSGSTATSEVAWGGNFAQYPIILRIRCHGGFSIRTKFEPGPVRTASSFPRA